MKRISLTQGQFAIVDDEDYERLSKHNWSARWNKGTKSFYALRHSKTIKGKRTTIYMAREILGLEFGDKREVDHINHNTLDNRKSEMRIVSRQQNMWNRKNPKGYTWHKYIKQYQAQIKVNGEYIFLGYFHTTEEAHSAYLRAKQKYHQIERRVA